MESQIKTLPELADIFLKRLEARALMNLESSSRLLKVKVAPPGSKHKFIYTAFTNNYRIQNYLGGITRETAIHRLIEHEKHLLYHN